MKFFTFLLRLFGLKIGEQEQPKEPPAENPFLKMSAQEREAAGLLITNRIREMSGLEPLARDKLPEQYRTITPEIMAQARAVMASSGVTLGGGDNNHTPRVQSTTLQPAR